MSSFRNTICYHPVDFLRNNTGLQSSLVIHYCSFLDCKATCTHTGFLPKSDPAPVVEFFTLTGIAAAGGQFDFERCTRKMFVHRNRKRNLLVLLYLRRKYKKRERQYWVHPVLAVRYLEGSFHTLFDFSILSL